jgi:Na+-translocating ferredoxin:NAD+ oxidoreductase RnfC subunit
MVLIGSPARRAAHSHPAAHQHVGAPAVPVVREGETVVVGQQVAAIPEGKLGADLHASICGRVTQVTGRESVIEE